MDEAPDYPPDAKMNLQMALIEELFSAGYFDERNLDNLATRMELCEHADLADRIRMLPVSAEMFAEMRGGGNERTLRG